MMTPGEDVCLHFLLCIHIKSLIIIHLKSVEQFSNLWQCPQVVCGTIINIMKTYFTPGIIVFK